MVQYRVNPSKLRGCISAPPSKSHSLRAILLASMADGVSVVRNVFASPDADAMIQACQALGAVIQREAQTLQISGVAGRPRVPDDVVDAGNSGQVLRFVAAMAALIQEGAVVFTGDHSVRHNRPMAPLLSGLTQLGARCLSTKHDGRAPVVIEGPIQAGYASIDGQDSQPVSALLMAAALLEGTSTIEVSNPGETPWVGLTLSWLDRLGVSYTNEGFQRFTVCGSLIKRFEYTVPGDFSAIAFPLVAALISGSTITIEGIDMSDAQGDKTIIEILQRMGADIEVQQNTLQVHGGTQLRGIEVDVNGVIDALPILAVLGCYAQGTTILHNAAIARQKESDRIEAMSQELAKMGARIKTDDDQMIIEGATLQGNRVYSYADHRIAMALAIAGCAAQKTTLIDDTQCVAKSYQNFVPDMQRLGMAIEVIA